MGQGEWQTVGKKRDANKDAQKQKARKADSTSQAASADAAPSPFDSLDAWRRGEDPGALPSSAGGAHLRMNGLNGHLTDDAGASSDASQGKPQAPSKPKKPKAPKVKKPTPQAAGAALKPDAITQVLRSAQQRYAQDERVQLDLLADHLVTAFREAELPFNKLLAEQPLGRVTDTPVDAVPAAVAAELTRFLGSKDAGAVAASASALIDAAFEGVPEAAGSSKAPPKANVGLLVALALALRAKPAALLLAADHLAAGGSRFCSSGRLPLLLWLLNQAAQGSEAVAVAVWVRVLLPQILGASAAASPAAGVPAKAGGPANGPAAAAPSEQEALSPALAARCFEYLDDLLRSPAVKRSMYSGVAVWDGQPPVPIVPPQTVAQMQLAVHGPQRLQIGAAATVRSHQAIVRAIALSGAPDGGFDAMEMLRLALDNAAAASSGAPDDSLVEDAAALVVEALAADDEAFGAWQSRHKHQLRGSSRVLAALDAGHPHATMPLMADPAKRVQLAALMPQLRQRHRYALQSGKGGQGAAARTADVAATSLEAKVKRDGSKSARRSIMMTIGGGLGLSMVVAVATGGSPFEHPMFQMVGRAAAAAGVTAVAQQAAQALEPYRQQAAQAAAPYVQPVVDAATPYLQQAQAAAAPYLEQASSTAAQASDFATGTLRNLTQAWLPGG